jgi:hypothetical protein
MKPYRLTIVKQGNVTTKYDRHFATLDRVYKAIIKMIDKSQSYIFNGNKIVIDGKITCVLYNESKPCYIPINVLIQSACNDVKYQGVTS